MGLPTNPLDRSLMFSFDGEDGDELRIDIECTSPCAVSKGLQAVDSNICHHHLSFAVLIGAPKEEVIGRALEQVACEAKVAQLLSQWLSLPITETLLHLILSSARRSLPISREIATQWSVNGQSTMPVAPANTRSRWSVSGASPRVPPLVSPVNYAEGNMLRQRRKSEPTIPTAFKTPPGSLRFSHVRLSFNDLAIPPSGPSAATLPSAIVGGGLLRRAFNGSGYCSPGSDARTLPSPVEVVYSPLSYFGTQPNVSSRFLHVPQGDGGVQTAFGNAAGGPDGSLDPEELFTLAVERLDLPRAVARLVVKRAQAKQREMSNAEPPPLQKENASTQMSQRSCGRSGGERNQGGSWGLPCSVVKGDSSVDAEERVCLPAFYAVYGRHRPEENDRIRLFRLIKRASTPWILKDDVCDLVWAVTQTHVGLEFLRDSAEFLEAYVNTTTLRILWALSAAGTERITLQHWRHSAITEVLFELDEEADINLARDYFSYNHFYVLWCIFWELDEDEDSFLTKEDVLRYGQYGLTRRTVDRLWFMRRDKECDGMGYNDFIYFLLSEEDKQATPALQYWFHLLDVDGDGCLDVKDMWYFYEDMRRRLEAMGEEVISFHELVNEFMDIVRPENRGKLTLMELKRSQLGFNIVSALTNVRKYIAWEGLSCEKAAGRASNLRDTRDWDLFADSEYRRLVESDEDGHGNIGQDGADKDPQDVEQSV